MGTEIALPKPHNSGGKDELYTKLWQACAGPLVYVPRNGEKVYYFPQGHIEQVEAYTREDGKMEMPVYNLPYKILCKVVYVQLKAEAGTDEVYAQIVLHPVPEQDELSLEDGNSLPLNPEMSVCSFSKKLTPSDTSTHGGFSVPKRHADECLPPLDMTQQPPVQELVAKDLHGLEWQFRHIYRGKPKRHLLTSGWSVFVTSKKLVSGDVCIFLRGENGELRVGIHRATKPHNNVSASVISGQSMQHGILAGAFHAISTGTMFTVYCRPWTSPSEFIIPFDRYMKSSETHCFVGTRFRMKFEGEECAEQRIVGTVVGIGDVDRTRWPNSEWRCLKVKWDTKSDRLTRPERISPWNIELIECTSEKPASVLDQPKRPRRIDASSPGFPSLVRNGVFQGQENGVKGVKELDVRQLPLSTHLVPPLNPEWGHIQPGLEKNPHFPMHDSFYPCPSSALSFPRGSIEWKDLELKDENQTPLAEQNGGSECLLFGVNINSPPELPSLQVANSSELESLCSVPQTSQSSFSETIQVSEPSKSITCIPSERQCKNCCFFKSRTKVHKYGTALGRSIDLARFDGYDELIWELDRMFEFKGSLIDESSGWQVIYTDNDGDMMMLIQDYPWQEFLRVVRRMFIYPKGDIDKLNPNSPNPTPL